MQGLAAVEATAEGDEDGGIGRPHGRPRWAGPAKRILYFYQAPGPDPAHYHQDNCKPSWPGWEGRVGKGEEERRGREGGRRKGVCRSASRGEEGGRGRKETETATQRGRGRGRRGELERARNGEAEERRRVRGGMSSTLQGGRGSVRGRLHSSAGRGMWEPMESQMENSFNFCILENFSFYVFLEFSSFNESLSHLNSSKSL